MNVPIVGTKTADKDSTRKKEETITILNPGKKQRVDKEFAALVKNSKMPKEELLAILNKKEE